MHKTERDAEDPKIRLVATITIALKDNWTNESTNVKIPLETDSPDKVLELLELALAHKLTRATIETWASPRMGAWPNGEPVEADDDDEDEDNGKGKSKGKKGSDAFGGFQRGTADERL